MKPNLVGGRITLSRHVFGGSSLDLGFKSP
jgi:hypothetical protein